MAFSCKSTKYLYLPMRIINIVFLLLCKYTNKN
nr:MAG TPA: hypothetical protein [Caudoviricetes sp.]